VDKLGRRLRETREAKGSTLEEAEAATRIRAHFLELLEAGDFAAFESGDVQVRGFLRIYARYLDLSPEEVLGRYRAEVHGTSFPAAEAAQQATESEAPEGPPGDDLTSIRFRPRDIPVTPSLPRWMSVRTVLIVGLVLTLLLGILAIATYLMNQPGDEGSFTPLTLAASLRITDTPPATAITDQRTPLAPASKDGEVTVTLEATEHTQVRVRRDGRVVFEQMMRPGQIETWTDETIIVIETGNGAALQVTVNGTALGTMCDRGELCTRAWGPSGEVTSWPYPGRSQTLE
jgi:transcriptional regulator with XRE-family HTH domain